LCAEATDGAYAPELVGELRPELVLIDVRMPLVGGIDALELIRQVDLDVHIVMLSAYSDGALVADALAAGASDYLVKGCPAEQLFSTLAQARGGGRPSRREPDA
jgi:YesN/AraC family two-component response regulator